MIQELLKDFNPSHSNFQIDNFIVRQEGHTPWGQYQQAMREAYSRFHSLRDNVMDALILAAEIEEEEAILSIPGASIAKVGKLKKIKKEYQLEAAIRALNPIIDEMIRFVSIILALKEKIGEVDDLERHRLDNEYWGARIQKRAACAIKDTSRIDSGIISIANSFPDNSGVLAVKRGLSGDISSPAELPSLARFTKKAEKLVRGMVSKIDRTAPGLLTHHAMNEALCGSHS